MINEKHNSEILDDLDVKASDLFQTNGIIWVEGPSDRLFILRWLEVFTDNKFREGIDFQFLYYGGRLLAHYEASESLSADHDLINILTTNRNAVLVMDSDKKNKYAFIELMRKLTDVFSSENDLCGLFTNLFEFVKEVL